MEASEANLDMVVAAAASGRMGLDKLDYTLLDEASLPALPIKVVRSEGNTPHLKANVSAHCDLVELTVQKVAQLAHLMMPLTRFRVPEKRVKGLLLDALNSGALDRGRVDPRLLAELEPTPVS
ncbi:MAG: hypothetical protein ABSG79_25060 [Bryobacteraceae bacterium]